MIGGLDPNVLSWLVELPHSHTLTVSVVFLARRDWRLCALGFARSSHPLSLHFEAWTEEETKLLLTKKKKDADKADVEEKRKGRDFGLPNTKLAERWAATVWQSTNVYTGPLLGMGVLHLVGLDGFNLMEPKARVIGSGGNSSQPAAAPQPSVETFFEKVNTQESASLYQDDQATGVSTPSSNRKKKRKEELAERARQKRLRILELDPPHATSLPRHEAAIVVAAYLASIVDKNKDSQLFSDEQSHKNKKSTKRGVTVANYKAGKMHRFSFERLIRIFRHVSSDSNFQPTPFWFSGVQSMVVSGFIQRLTPKDEQTRLDPKIFRAKVSLTTVLRLAEEIGYEGVHIALEAQN